MASTGESTEDNISWLSDVTGLSRPQAIIRLKANNNDVQRACNEFFEDPDGQKYKWDESQFNTDREGGQNYTGISFNIQGPDELPPSSFQNSAAPTRPPSRTSNRSPLGAPTNLAQEDADLQRALAESAAASGFASQETGIIDNGTSQKFFGPANRSDYQTDDWALVPTATLAQTVQIEPSPSNRKRSPDSPAFLHQTKDHRVGAVLSIYHKIPLVRNILLRCGSPARNYGHNTEWWRGQPILKQESLAAMARGETVSGDQAHPDFGEEIHRLMAFLDQTDRNYGSIDNLIETESVDPTFGAWPPDVEDTIFQAIKDECVKNPDCDINPVMTTGKLVPVAASSGEDSADDTSGSDEEEQMTSFMFLDVVLDSEQYSWVSTLYNALDHLLWSNALALDHPFPQDANYAVLSKPAEVMTIRLGGTGLVKPCEIPAIFYVDRYMKDRSDLAMRFQTQIRSYKEWIRYTTTCQQRHVQCKLPEHAEENLDWLKQPHDMRKCFQVLIKRAEWLIDAHVRRAKRRHWINMLQERKPLSMQDLYLIHDGAGPYELSEGEAASTEKLKGVIEQYRLGIEELNKKIADLKDKEEEYAEKLEVASKRLTCQEHEADNDKFVFRDNPEAYRPEYWNPAQKYLLRGVAVTDELAYVCVRNGRPLANGVDESDPRDQWWKVGYAPKDSSPIKTEKVALDEALQAAGTGSKHPILVYATEAALEEEQIPLSDALRLFVKADNRSFQQEIVQEQSAQNPQLQDYRERREADLQPVPVTAESLSHVPPLSGTALTPGGYCIPKMERRHSDGSSVATGVTAPGDLDDVDLTFPEHDTGGYDEANISVTNEEPTQSSPGTQRIGRLTERLSNFQASEEESPVLGQAATDTAMTDTGSMEEMQVSRPSSALSREPEMQERNGGSLFLTRPGTTKSAQVDQPIDMMDLDVEEEQNGPAHRA